MRFAIPLFALALYASPAAATPPTASASLFAERTALLAADSKCTLLSAHARAALIATTGQARAGALRDGWTFDAIDGVGVRAATAGSGRACTDGQLLAAAKSASVGFKSWAGMQAMNFPGRDRAWFARRTPDPEGWMLRQSLPNNSQFGVVIAGGVQRLALGVPLGAGAPPSSASLYLRDGARAPRPLIDVPGLPVQPGIAGAAAPRSLSTARLANARLIERPKKAPARVLYTFPDSMLGELAALDPREAVTIELAADTPGAKAAKIYVEIGDLAVARAFLAARPN